MVKQTTRDRMIEKASQLIREYGYQNIPLRKLASLLGVTTGAFYKAFENKEELYYQVCLLENQRQLKRLEEQYLDGVSDPLDCIWQIGLFLLSEYKTNSQMMDFLFFSPVATEAYRKGELLESGTRQWIIWIGCLLRVSKRKRFSCSRWIPSSQAMAILLPKAWSLLMRKSIAQCSMIY